jgi:peroxiredoxin
MTPARILILGLASLALGILILILPAYTSPAQANQVDFQLPDTDGTQRRLSDYRGKWVVVNYWATWCPPCLEELPELERFHLDHQQKNAMVLGINMERITPDALRRFVDEQMLSYPILMAEPASATELGKVPGMPVSFIVNPQGQVVARKLGAVTAKLIEKMLTEQQSGKVQPRLSTK